MTARGHRPVSWVAEQGCRIGTEPASCTGRWDRMCPQLQEAQPRSGNCFLDLENSRRFSRITAGLWLAGQKAVALQAADPL